MRRVPPEESAAIVALTNLLSRINQIEPKHMRMGFLAFVANRLKLYVEAGYDLEVMTNNMEKEMGDHGTSN